GVAHIPDSWSPDGQNLLFDAIPGNARSVQNLSMRDRTTKSLLTVAGGYPAHAVFSGDGHWVAYSALLTGKTSVFIEPYPPTGAKYQVPQDGNNHHPVFSPDAKQLFYVPGNSLFAFVSVKTQPSVSFGAPVQMPKGSGFFTGPPAAVRSYDI